MRPMCFLPPNSGLMTVAMVAGRLAGLPAILVKTPYGDFVQVPRAVPFPSFLPESPHIEIDLGKTRLVLVFTFCDRIPDGSALVNALHPSETDESKLAAYEPLLEGVAAFFGGVWDDCRGQRRGRLSPRWGGAAEPTGGAVHHDLQHEILRLEPVRGAVKLGPDQTGTERELYPDRAEGETLPDGLAQTLRDVEATLGSPQRR